MYVKYLTSLWQQVQYMLDITFFSYACFHAQCHYLTCAVPYSKLSCKWAIAHMFAVGLEGWRWSKSYFPGKAGVFQSRFIVLELWNMPERKILERFLLCSNHEMSACSWAALLCHVPIIIQTEPLWGPINSHFQNSNQLFSNWENWICFILQIWNVCLGTPLE